jgi:hypothetical protein
MATFFAVTEQEWINLDWIVRVYDHPANDTLYVVMHGPEGNNSRSYNGMTRIRLLTYLRSHTFYDA